MVDPKTAEAETGEVQEDAPAEEEKEEEEPPVDYKREEHTAAKQKHDDLKRDMDKLQREYDKQEKQLKHDFGADNVYFKMLQQCYEAKFKQYTYSICPFDSAKQKEGGSSTRLQFVLS